MDCVDLREIAKQKRWRWRYEESFKAEKNKQEKDYPWYVEILCQYGLIYPWGDDDLLVYTTSGRIRAVLGSMGLRRHQSGDREAVFRFHKDQLLAVASTVRPRKKHPGPTQTPAMAAGLAKARAAQHTARQVALGTTISDADGSQEPK